MFQALGEAERIRHLAVASTDYHIVVYRRPHVHCEVPHKFQGGGTVGVFFTTKPYTAILSFHEPIQALLALQGL